MAVDPGWDAINGVVRAIRASGRVPNTNSMTYTELFELYATVSGYVNIILRRYTTGVVACGGCKSVQIQSAWILIHEAEKDTIVSLGVNFSLAEQQQAR